MAAGPAQAHPTGGSWLACWPPEFWWCLLKGSYVGCQVGLLSVNPLKMFLIGSAILQGVPTASSCLYLVPFQEAYPCLGLASIHSVNKNCYLFLLNDVHSSAKHRDQRHGSSLVTGSSKERWQTWNDSSILSVSKPARQVFNSRTLEGRTWAAYP